MPPKTKTRSTSHSRKTSSTASSGGGGSKTTEHLAAALKLLGDRFVFADEVTKREFDDHLTLATGGPNKDAVAVAKERHDERTAAAKAAEG